MNVKLNERMQRMVMAQGDRVSFGWTWISTVHALSIGLVYGIVRSVRSKARSVDVITYNIRVAFH